MIPRFLAAGMILCTLVVAACGSGSGENGNEPTGTAVVSATEPSATPERRVESTATPRPTRAPATPTATAEPERIEVVDHGYYQEVTAFGTYIYWFAAAENISDRSAEFVRIRAVFFDEAGLAMETSDEYAYFWPHQVAAVTSRVEMADVPSRMEIQIDEPSSREAMEGPLFPAVTGVEVIRDGNSGLIRGSIASPWETNVEDLKLVCIGRDGDGSVVVARSTILDVLAAETTGTGECKFFGKDVLADVATAEMFVMADATTDGLG